MNKPVGILAIQGGYEAHAQTLISLGVNYLYITLPEHLEKISALIIPGGESTTLLKFITENGLFIAIKKFSRPIFGTCAGAILLAQAVSNPEQPSLELIDITIERNAYGRQIDSHISHGLFIPTKKNIDMVFIRAPKIKINNDHVTILARCNNEIVCVQQGNYLAASFHPELSNNTTVHKYFLELSGIIHN